MRDNLNETAVAKATTNGSLFVATGSNSIAERIPVRDFVSDEQSTASTSYTNLTTPGPSVTVTSSTNAILLFGCRMWNSSAGHFAHMSFDVSGASSIAASDTRAFSYESSNNSDEICATVAMLRDDLTPGSNVITAKYRAFNGTASFRLRRMDVVPL